MDITITDHNSKLEVVEQVYTYDRHFKFLVLDLDAILPAIPTNLVELFWFVWGMDFWLRYEGLSFPVFKTGLFGLSVGVLGVLAWVLLH